MSQGRLRTVLYVDDEPDIREIVERSEEHTSELQSPI